MYPRRFDTESIQTLQANHIWLDVGRMIFAAAVIAAVLLVVYKIAMHLTAHRPSAPVNAMDIVKQRYAKGEITKEEFEQLKKELA